MSSNCLFCGEISVVETNITGLVLGADVSLDSAKYLCRLLHIPFDDNDSVLENLRRCNYCSGCRTKVAKVHQLVSQMDALMNDVSSFKAEFQSALSQIVETDEEVAPQDATQEIREIIRSELGLTSMFEEEESEFKILEVRSHADFPTDKQPDSGSRSSYQEESNDLVMEEESDFHDGINLEDECLFPPTLNDDVEDNVQTPSFYKDPLSITSESSYSDSLTEGISEGGSQDGSYAGLGNKFSQIHNAVFPEPKKLTLPIDDVIACLNPSSYDVTVGPDGRKTFRLTDKTLTLNDVLQVVSQFQASKVPKINPGLPEPKPEKELLSFEKRLSQMDFLPEAPQYQLRIMESNDDEQEESPPRHTRIRKGGNIKERLRRADCATKMANLKKLIPRLNAVGVHSKPLALGFSKAEILQAATEYINQLQKTEEVQIKELRHLRDRHEALRRQYTRLTAPETTATARQKWPSVRLSW